MVRVESDRRHTGALIMTNHSPNPNLLDISFQVQDPELVFYGVCDIDHISKMCTTSQFAVLHFGWLLAYTTEVNVFRVTEGTCDDTATRRFC